MGAYLTELGKSVSFGRLSLKGKVLWPMLLAASDDQGRGLADADVIKWHVCPNVNEITQADIEAILAEMVTLEMIVMYADSRGRALYQIVNWWLHQRKRFARGSLYEAPEDWTDKVFLVRGKVVEKLNWDQPGGFTRPLPGLLGDDGDGQYVGAYATAYAGQYAEEYSSPKLNRTKLTLPKPTVPDANGGGGSVFSIENWERLYTANIGKLVPAVREEIRGLFEDERVSFGLWEFAITTAVANDTPEQRTAKLSYVRGVIKNRLAGGAGRDPPTVPGTTTTRVRRKKRSEDDD